MSHLTIKLLFIHLKTYFIDFNCLHHLPSLPRYQCHLILLGLHINDNSCSMNLCLINFCTDSMLLFDQDFISLWSVVRQALLQISYSRHVQLIYILINHQYYPSHSIQDLIDQTTYHEPLNNQAASYTFAQLQPIVAQFPSNPVNKEHSR